MVVIDEAASATARAARSPWCVALLSCGSDACARRHRSGRPTQTPTLDVGFGLATGQTARPAFSRLVTNLRLEGLVALLERRPAAAAAGRSVDVSSGRPDAARYSCGRTSRSTTAARHRRRRRETSSQRDLPRSHGPGVRRRRQHRSRTSTTRSSSASSDRSHVPARRPRTSPIQKPGDPRSEPARSVGRPIGAIEVETAGERRATTRAARRSTGSSFKPYPSVRAAWADMLRGDVDMLYEVGVDALDSLEPSTNGQGLHVHSAPTRTCVVLNTQAAGARTSRPFGAR